ncbi:exo-alpha-sialidase [Brachyspira pilosicoli]|uniref:sialidase family protein n=1 Tax=Brachyspira pilosicoli TaxID=52584 RepID=UPI001CA5EE30|nr:sialidase family protein [Brachyspira pilosicoli]MBW5398516.1 exo-alpha-sialidase [Brachyspira pilosicoli]
MSKKIIYLLSLLMALSLVFASCKKNAAGTGPDLGGLTPPPEEDNTDQADKNTGLFDDWNKIPTTEIIKKTTVFKSGEDFYRNPVVVSMGNGVVFFFSEVRYKREGAANDVGVDGGGIVDIVYKGSKDSGITFGQTKTVNANYTITDKVENSHGAAVVFKATSDKIVVVASSGGGIGRTKQKVNESGKLASKVDYIVGTVASDNITWDSAGWKEVQVDGSKTILSQIESIEAGGPSSAKVKFNQYGTQSARGFVPSDNTIILPIVLANQGSTSDTYELMGRYTLKGSLSDNTVTWTAVGNPIAYSANENAKLGKWKETQAIGGTAEAPNFIVVPSPWSNPKNTKLGKSENVSAPQTLTIQASEGAPGYVDLTGKWYGKETYTISGGNMTTGSGNASILMHVQDISANLTMYVVDTASLTVKGTGGFKINDVGKASSIDVLPDGTIITGAEEGGQAKNYYGVFTRYSQYYIADKTGN